MSTWVAPATFVSAAVLTAAQLNATRDNLTFLKGALDLLTNSTTADTGSTMYLYAPTGLQFPATAVPNADVNRLDDYEEGTWTPTITFVTPGNLTVVYSTQDGKYTKVGNRVYITCSIITSTFTHTTASGEFRVEGLPFAIGSGFHGKMGGSFDGYTKANYTLIAFQPLGGATNFRATGSGSGQATANFTTADLPTGGTITIHFGGHYNI